jgi:glycosyltransferase involved in cell wall biosynthesis
MERIYWWIQQLDKIGGTEEVSVDLMNHLADSFDITLISTSSNKDKIVYHLDPRIKVMSLGFPGEVIRCDQFTSAYFQHHQYLKIIKLWHQIVVYYFYRRHKIQKRLESLLKDEKSVLICSSVDSYWLSPRKGHVYYHFHFNSHLFFAFATQFVLAFSRKPDKMIFLSSSTLEKVTSRRKKLKAKSLYIYNPIRFTPVLDLTYHDNTIIFAGRYSYQKNPLLALQTALELKKRNFPFHLKMFGQGAEEEKMKAFVRENNLSEQVSINPPTEELSKEIADSDLLLLTSRFEGFVLVKGEAAALSRPCVSSDWGDTVNEMIVQGEDGYIVNSDDPSSFAEAVEKVLSDKERLLEMKKKAFESSQKLSHEKIMPQWIKLLSD